MTIKIYITTYTRIIVSCFLLLTMATGKSLAQATFKAQADRTTIARNETVQIDFTINTSANIENVKCPSFEKFRVVSGPTQMQQTSSINGKTSSSFSISFVLQPIAPGTFTIPAATALVNGRQVQSNTLQITVENKDSKNPGGNSQQAQPSFPSILSPFGISAPKEVPKDVVLKPGENPLEKIKKGLKLVLQVSKTNCYVGEPLVATYKFYKRVHDQSHMAKAPSLDGFGVYDMLDPNNTPFTEEKLNGILYNVYIIRKVQLLPLQPGTFTLDTMEIQSDVHFVIGSTIKKRPAQQRSLLEDILGEQDADMGEWQTYTATTKSNSATITVKPLPAINKPASFTGAVGEFEINAAPSSPEIHAGDAGSIQLTINGKGNFPMINAPVLQYPQDIDGTEPNSKEEVDKSVAPMEGRKMFEYNFIPNKAGTYTIPTIEFSYFNPATGSYKTLKTEPFTIKVLPPAERKAVASEKMKGKRGNYWWYVIGGLILTGGVLGWSVISRKKTPASVLHKPAMPAANKEVEAEPLIPATDETTNSLNAATTALEQGDSKQFFTLIQESLLVQMSKILRTPTNTLNKKETIDSLLQQGLDTHTATSLNTILSTCEMALYTPQSASNMQDTLHKTTFVINELQRLQSKLNA